MSKIEKKNEQTLKRLRTEKISFDTEIFTKGAYHHIAELFSILQSFTTNAIKNTKHCDTDIQMRTILVQMLCTDMALFQYSGVIQAITECQETSSTGVVALRMIIYQTI